MAKEQALKEYQRVYRNAKAKERRLKQQHGVTVDFKLLTPTEWKNAPNKKRETQKLDDFSSGRNKKYDYVSLGKESIKRSEYQKIAQENKKVIDSINYHKKKTLKRVLDKPYMVMGSDGVLIKTDQVVNDRMNELRKQSLNWQGNHSHKQQTKAQLERYSKAKKDQLKNLKKMSYAKIQKKNYINKLEDFSKMFKGTPYEVEHKRFMKEMKKLSPEDYEAFYYLADMGSIDRIKYINEAEVGTPEGTEKIYDNMKQVQIAWESVSKLISS